MLHSVGEGNNKFYTTIVNPDDTMEKYYLYSK